MRIDINYYYFCIRLLSSVHKKNNFATISKNLDKYRSENNFGLRK